MNSSFSVETNMHKDNLFRNIIFEAVCTEKRVPAHLRLLAERIVCRFQHKY